MRHVIGIEDLSVEEIESLIATAQDIMKDPKKYSTVAAGKKIATLFYEPSTRTRLSFESAMIELGGKRYRFFRRAELVRIQGRERCGHHQGNFLLC